MSENVFYLLVTYENNDRYPYWNTTDGDVAIPLFKTEESAAHYAKKHPDEDWVPRASTPAKALTWINESAEKCGVSVVAIDPDPAETDSAAYLPIEIMRQILEKC